MDTSEYLLRDPENEKRLNCNLGKSLVRAKSNAGKLLHGQTVYVTPDVHGGFDVCKSIVEANGGVCVNYRMMKRPANAPLSETLVLLCNVDTNKSMLSAFRKMAVEAGREYKIYRADWLLDLAMTQKVEWSDKYSLGNKD